MGSLAISIFGIADNPCSPFRSEAVGRQFHQVCSAETDAGKMQCRLRQHAFDEETTRGKFCADALRLRLRGKPSDRRLSYPAPHEGERNEAHQVEVVARSGCYRFRLSRVMHQPLGRFLQVAERSREWTHKRLHRLSPVPADIGPYFGKKRLQRTSVIQRELAAHQIERLNSVGALV